MEPENQNMLAAGKKSVVKCSGNALQDTANASSSTMKKAHSIFYQGYPYINENRYSKGVLILDISAEIKIIVDNVVLKNLFTTKTDGYVYINSLFYSIK